VIRSFRNKEAEAIFHGLSSRRFQEVQRIAQRKLKQLNAAAQLRDLAMFPGNHLEALKGNRRGQYSIRINDQYRICFAWSESDAYDVEITDYH